MKDKKCPKCGNTMGFAFGTCVDCGWNHLSNQFKFIQIWTDDLPEEIQDYLIQKHANKYERR